MRSGAGIAAALTALALIPASAEADVIAPTVVTPKVVTPTVVTPTTTAPQVTPPSTPSPAPAAQDPGAAATAAPSQSESSDQYFEPQAAREWAPPPRAPWQQVKDAHDDLQATYGTTWQADFAAALTGRVALTANEIVASAVLVEAFGGFALGPEKTGPGQVLANMLDADYWGRNPGGIADIIDNVFGTSSGPIQQTIDAESAGGQIPEGGAGQAPQSEKDEYGPKDEQ